MKKQTIYLVGIALLLFAVTDLWSLPRGFGEKRATLVIGPRVGATVIVARPAEFDNAVQEMYPDSERKYFPVITQFGISLEQRIKLGDTESHFAFQEVITLGGLDQNIVIPSFNFLIGFRSRMGLEIGMGPNISMKKTGDSIKPTVSVIYAVGWTFSFKDVYVPVDIAVVPTPSDGCPRISVLTGFNFEI